jgi:hypothetical protein
VTRAPMRRAFLAGSFAVPAAAALPAMATSVDRVKEAGIVLAAALQARHGGQWLTIVDLDGGFVLTRPCFPVEEKGTAARVILGRKRGAL